MNSLKWSSKQAVLRLFPLIITISFAMDVFVPAMPLMGKYFHISNENVQASLYLFMLTVAITQLIIGPLADKFSRRMTARITAMLFLLGSIICALANSITILLLGRIIQAMGACGTYLLCFIVVRDNFSTKQCGRLFSLLTGINSIVASLAPIIGGILLDLTHSWRSGFDFLSALGILILLAAVFNIPHYETNTTTLIEQPLSNWQLILKNDYFKRYTLIASGSLLGLYLFCALSPEILINKLHLTGTYYGLWFGLNASTVFVANLIAANLTKKLRLEAIVKNGLLVMIVACISMILFNLYHTNVYSFMLPMLAMTFGIGMSMGCAIALALRDFANCAGVATSMVSANQFAFCAFIGAIVSTMHLSPLVLALPVLIVASLGFLAIIRQGLPPVKC